MKKILSVLIAFLLTGSLILFGLTFTVGQVIAPAMEKNGAQVSEAVIGGETDLIRERITGLAEIYGFSAEPVIAVVNEESVRDMNRQASAWWSSVFRIGTAGDVPAVDTKAIEKAILADETFLQSHDPDETDYLAGEAAAAVSESVLRVVLPLRLTVVNRGLTEAGNVADLPNLLSFLTEIPWAALALSALLAGLIALLGSRKLRYSFQYIGSALGGAALVLIAAAVFALASGLRPLILEASASLALQYDVLASGMLVRLGILAAVMLAGCAACLILCRKDGKKA